MRTLTFLLLLALSLSLKIQNLRHDPEVKEIKEEIKTIKEENQNEEIIENEYQPEPE